MTHRPRTQHGQGEREFEPEFDEEEPASSTGVRFRRAISLLLLTLLAPGSAQVIAGNRRVGIIVLKVYGGLVGITALGVLISKLFNGFGIWLATTPTVLSGARIVLLLLAVGWFALFVDALRLADPQSLLREQRLWASGIAVFLSIVVVGALVTGSHYVEVTHDSITSIFHAQKVSEPKAGRYNVLLLGGDAGPGRVGLRPDSMTLVSIDERSGGTSMFSFPRNLQRVPFKQGSPMHKAWPNGFDCGTECLLNAVNTWANAHKDLFPPGTPDPGITATRDAIEGLTGLHVNYYVLVDMGGFRQLIDAVGGVQIDVKATVPVGPLRDPYRQIIKPGRYQFNGEQALLYARARSGSSDYYRMARQRCVMSAMLRQLEPGTVLRRFEAIAHAGSHIVHTDIPASELGAFVQLARKAKQGKVVSLQFVPPLIRTARPDLPLIRRKVGEAIQASTGPEPKASHAGRDHEESRATMVTRTDQPKPGGDRKTDVADLGQVCAAG